MIGRLLSVLLGAGRLGTEGLRAQAAWELEVSRTMLGRRRKVLLVALLPVLAVLIGGPAMAALPASIGGQNACMPAAATASIFLGSILIGLLAGLITGVIGAGGGYILTPALMSFGVKGIMAVGTDQFHLFAKAIMGTVIHRRLGNVNLRLALWFVVGSIAGVSAGGWLNRRIYDVNQGLSDAFICLMYVLILGTLGFYALHDWWRLRRQAASGRHPAEATTRLARWLQSLPLLPRISFDPDSAPGGRSISVYPVIACGAVVGFLAAIIGVGGGFMTFPMFVYGLGVSTFTTVGTDILQIIFTTAYSSIFQYAIYGFVFYTVAMGMLLGSLIGVQIGAMVTATARGSTIRAFYAVTILAGFANRLAALPGKLGEAGLTVLSPGPAAAVEMAGILLFFAMIGLFGIWVLWSFFRNLPALRAADGAGSAGSAGDSAAGGAAR
ncbi:MAG TPA: sulfite exporter TauE/SafE family protein [Planctomycetota bacterium]|nr:sulfite exporter TauE/SafE family protein [Planctomycetota bacterium]